MARDKAFQSHEIDVNLEIPAYSHLLTTNPPLDIEAITDTPETPSRAWIKEVICKLNRFQANSVRKEKSPSVQVNVENAVVVITIDEGAELNCIDEEFCLKNKKSGC